jgi:hypothetical protein
MNEQEVKALARLAKQVAEWKGEDMIGALIYTGAFHHLTDQEIVDLAHKLEKALEC